MHRVQEKGFSPACDIICLFRWPDGEKALLHLVQPTGFSPLCDILCVLRWSDLKKSLFTLGAAKYFLSCVKHLMFLQVTFSHRLQPKDFSPVCDLIWLFRLPCSEKALLHWVQTKGFSPVCNSICLLKWFDIEKAFSHRVQAKYFSPVWDFLCVLKPTEEEKFFPDRVQPKGFSPVWHCMYLEVIWLRKGPITLCAAKWLYSCMWNHMCL